MALVLPNPALALRNEQAVNAGMEEELKTGLQSDAPVSRSASGLEEELDPEVKDLLGVLADPSVQKTKRLYHLSERLPKLNSSQRGEFVRSLVWYSDHREAMDLFKEVFLHEDPIARLPVRLAILDGIKNDPTGEAVDAFETLFAQLPLEEMEPVFHRTLSEINDGGLLEAVLEEINGLAESEGPAAVDTPVERGRQFAPAAGGRERLLAAEKSPLAIGLARVNSVLFKEIKYGELGSWKKGWETQGPVLALAMEHAFLFEIGRQWTEEHALSMQLEEFLYKQLRRVAAERVWLSRETHPAEPLTEGPDIEKGFGFFYKLIAHRLHARQRVENRRGPFPTHEANEARDLFLSLRNRLSTYSETGDRFLRHRVLQRMVELEDDYSNYLVSLGNLTSRDPAFVRAAQQGLAELQREFEAKRELKNFRIETRTRLGLLEPPASFTTGLEEVNQAKEEPPVYTIAGSSPKRLEHLNLMLVEEHRRGLFHRFVEIGPGWPSASPTQELLADAPGLKVVAIDNFVPEVVVESNGGFSTALFNAEGKITVVSPTFGNFNDSQISAGNRKYFMGLKEKLIRQSDAWWRQAYRRTFGLQKPTIFADKQGNRINFRPLAVLPFPVIEGDLNHLGKHPEAVQAIQQAELIRIANLIVPYFTAEQRRATLERLARIMTPGSRLIVVYAHPWGPPGEEAVEYLRTESGLSPRNFLVSLTIRGFGAASDQSAVRAGGFLGDSLSLMDVLYNSAGFKEEWAGFLSQRKRMPKIEMDLIESDFEYNAPPLVAKGLTEIGYEASSRAGLVSIGIKGLLEQHALDRLPAGLLPEQGEEFPAISAAGLEEPRVEAGALIPVGARTISPDASITKGEPVTLPSHGPANRVVLPGGHWVWVNGEQPYFNSTTRRWGALVDLRFMTRHPSQDAEVEGLKALWEFRVVDADQVDRHSEWQTLSRMTDLGLSFQDEEQDSYHLAIAFDLKDWWDFGPPGAVAPGPAKIYIEVRQKEPLVPLLPEKALIGLEGPLVEGDRVVLNRLADWLKQKLNALQGNDRSLPGVNIVLVRGSAGYLSDDQNRLPVTVMNNPDLIGDLDVAVILKSPVSFDDAQEFRRFYEDHEERILADLKNNLTASGVVFSGKMDGIVESELLPETLRQDAEYFFQSHQGDVNEYLGSELIRTAWVSRGEWNPQYQSLDVAKRYLEVEQLAGDLAFYRYYRDRLVSASDPTAEAAKILQEALEAGRKDALIGKLDDPQARQQALDRIQKRMEDRLVGLEPTESEKAASWVGEVLGVQEPMPEPVRGRLMAGNEIIWGRRAPGAMIPMLARLLRVNEDSPRAHNIQRDRTIYVEQGFLPEGVLKELSRFSAVPVREIGPDQARLAVQEQQDKKAEDHKSLFVVKQGSELEQTLNRELDLADAGWKLPIAVVAVPEALVSKISARDLTLYLLDILTKADPIPQRRMERLESIRDTGEELQLLSTRA